MTRDVPFDLTRAVRDGGTTKPLSHCRKAFGTICAFLVSLQVFTSLVAYLLDVLSTSTIQSPTKCPVHVWARTIVYSSMF